jgi:hypothetical protein
VFRKPLLDEQRAELIASITGAKRVVFGHTHEPVEQQLGPVQYLNGGCWSPAFAEPDMKTRIGTQTFVWIRPSDTSDEREAALFEWPPGGSAPRAFAGPQNREMALPSEAATSNDQRTAARMRAGA